jgi:hypothetical protein
MTPRAGRRYFMAGDMAPVHAVDSLRTIVP